MAGGRVADARPGSGRRFFGGERPHVAYVVYWGATEPLGRTVAVPSVIDLSRWVDVTLMSFEKPEDRSVPERMEAVRSRLEDAGVAWSPMDYHRSPPVVSSFRDVASGVSELRRLHRKRPFDLVLGRTFVGGLIGSRAAEAMDVPFVYYHDACWPEEQVDAGKWGEGSLRDHVARRLEAGSFRAATGVVTLTRRTLERLRREGLAPPSVPGVVAPTSSGLIQGAADLAPRAGGRKAGAGGPVRVVYLGGVTGRYPLESILDFAEALRDEVPGSVLAIYAHRDRELVRREVERRGLEDATLVDFAEPDELPDVLRSYDAGLVLLRPGLSASCQTPTKVGEYLAFGLPVVSNEVVGDVPRIVREHRVGVVLESLDRTDLQTGVRQLLPLVDDSRLPERARRTSYTLFDGQAIARRQVELFSEILE